MLWFIFHSTYVILKLILGGDGMNTGDLYIVNYCHRNCVPLKNIMRLPKEEAFKLAYEMAQRNKNTTAFYRFADFENYYSERLKTDKLLYSQICQNGWKSNRKTPSIICASGQRIS